MTTNPLTISDSDIFCYRDAYNMALRCSAGRNPREFASKVLSELENICYYDEAVVFFLDANGQCSDGFMINADEEYINEYLNYYAKPKDGKEDFCLFRNASEATLGSDHYRLISWDDTPNTDFIKYNVQTRALKFSWGFCFFDMNGAYRVVFSLNRTKNVPFSTIEQLRLRLIIPLLNNINRLYFYQENELETIGLQSHWKQYHLTKREAEIASLICQGMTVQNISTVQNITINTVYKHFAHIYEKTGVSSQRQLVVKLTSH